jgi:hypothetical protein
LVHSDMDFINTEKNCLKSKSNNKNCHQF